MIRSAGPVQGQASSVDAVAGEDGRVTLTLYGKQGGRQGAITLFSFDTRALGERLISESVIAGMTRREDGTG